MSQITTFINTQSEIINKKGYKNRRHHSREPVMKGYQQEIGLVVVLSDGGQTLRNELRFHLLTTYDDLHPRLQVQNTAICLCPLKQWKWKVKRYIFFKNLNIFLLHIKNTDHVQIKTVAQLHQYKKQDNESTASGCTCTAVPWGNCSHQHTYLTCMHDV